MSYDSRQYVPERQAVRKEKGTSSSTVVIVSLVIGAIVIAMGGFLLVSRTTISKQTKQIAAVTYSRDSALDELKIVSEKLDALTGKNMELEGRVLAKDVQIRQLKNKLSNISKQLEEHSISDAQLEEAKQEIALYRTQVDSLYSSLKNARNDNQSLSERMQASQQEFSAKAAQLEAALASSKTETENMKIYARTIHISDIQVQGVVLAGKKETVISSGTSLIKKKATAFKIRFSIDDNQNLESGDQTVYICIIGPGGEVIGSQGSFTAKDEGNKQYTEQRGFAYTKGQANPQSFYYKCDIPKMKIGKYLVQFYHNTMRVGEGSISITK